MEYRRVGRSGLEISTIGFGTWPASAPQEDAALQLIRRAYELGVRYFDTANFYLGGLREETVGRALQIHPRGSYVLGTKVGFPIGAPPNNAGLSRKHVREQCDASLRRLGTDHIDLYQAHKFDPNTPVEETCAAMDHLVRAGKILYWGTCSSTPEQLRQILRACDENHLTRPISEQPQYSAVWRVPEVELLPLLRDEGLGLIAWSPLAMGVLAGRYTPGDPVPEDSRAASEEGKWMTRYRTDGTVDAVHGLRAPAAAAELTLSQLALQWCLSEPAVACAIVGASRESQLEESLGAAHRATDRALVESYGATLSPFAVRTWSGY